MTARAEMHGESFVRRAAVMNAGIRQKVMDIGDAPRHRILDRDKRIADRATAHRGNRVLERRARDRLKRLVVIDAGDMGIGARLALIGDADARCCVRCGCHCLP